MRKGKKSAGLIKQSPSTKRFHFVIHSWKKCSCSLGCILSSMIMSCLLFLFSETVPTTLLSRMLCHAGNAHYSRSRNKPACSVSVKKRQARKMTVLLRLIPPKVLTFLLLFWYCVPGMIWNSFTGMRRVVSTDHKQEMLPGSTFLHGSISANESSHVEM